MTIYTREDVVQAVHKYREAKEKAQRLARFHTELADRETTEMDPEQCADHFITREVARRESGIAEQQCASSLTSLQNIVAFVADKKVKSP